jgi:ribonuclease E
MDSKNKMLIDATHPEETRVVVLKGNRVEEFDFESAARKPLRGNIYLAKVTRVEPSLQAAFVEYGGNRHGFLAFSEIHPDYYQIPKADREALIREEADADAEAEAQADARAEARDRNGGGNATSSYSGEEASYGTEAPHDDAPSNTMSESTGLEGPADRQFDDQHLAARQGEHVGDHGNGDGADIPSGHVEEVAETVEAPETLTPTDDAPSRPDDVMEEVPERPRRRMRSYKIQEVIKRRQIILVQVVKEERGTKGAALTTYLSLAGRYTVLMPNTGRGGGISRKIGSAQDRKRLKAIATELDVPDGMGLIIRTAGAARTKPEIKRDYEYLIRLWESVRDMTLQSVAPNLVYEEGNLIKRSIRDLFTKDVQEIVVAGEEAYKEAHDFMRMLMPSHVKNVINFTEPEPIFARYPIERQLNAMFSPHVTLKSGGYIVINQTEALVAIDVNSGKSTREFSIEETALNTNLEAADEIARQLKLRDLAGLIVVDFIDMEEKRNNRAVERRIKDALRFDRARIQVGRISHFGLLEMSRQRLRTGVVEGSSSQCPHCMGAGTIRSTESIALAVLRGIDEHLTRDHRSSIKVEASAEVAFYVLNQKRSFVSEMEQRHGVRILVEASDRMHGAAFAIERSSEPLLAQRRAEPRAGAAVNMDWGFEGEDAPAQSDELPDQIENNVEDVGSDDDQDDDRGDHEARDNGHQRHGRGEGCGEGSGEVRDGERGDDRQGRRRRRRGRGRGRDRDRGEGGERHAGGGEGNSEHGDRNGHSAHEHADHEHGHGPEDHAHQPQGSGEHTHDHAQDFAGNAGNGHEGEHGGEGYRGRDDNRGDQQGQEDGGGSRRGRRRRRGRRGGRRGEGGFEQGGQNGGEGHGDPGAENVSGAQSLLDPVPQDTHGGGYAARAAAALAGAPHSPPEPVHDHVREPAFEAPRQQRYAPEPVSAAPAAPSYAAVAVHAHAETAPVARYVEPVREAMRVESPPEPKPEPLLTPVITEDADPSRPARKGWWQRKFSSE